MKIKVVLALLGVAVFASACSSGSHGKAKSASGNATSGMLPSSKIILKSALALNLDTHSVKLPIHRGTFKGQTVWYILTEASDFGLAHDLNVNFSPKLANMAIACPKCVQTVTGSVPPKNAFGEPLVHFKGIPNFKPQRKLVAGPPGFPPSVATPGAIGGPGYSPFIRFPGSSVVYNAPIIAVGPGPYDVVHHTNTSDRVLDLQPPAKPTPGHDSVGTAEILLVHGFDAGNSIFYISTESSQKLPATLERATFVPLLAKAAFLGADDSIASARERIFIFANGQTGAGNGQAQGIDHLISDGHAAEDASLANTKLLESLRNDGDLLNVLGDFPSLADPRHANAYSPLWDAQVGQWTKAATDKGQNKRQTDENEILNLVATHPDLITGPKGAPYGSAGFVINCPIIAFTDKLPTADTTALLPAAQG